MKNALMIAAVVLASSTGAWTAGASQQHGERGAQLHKHHANSAIKSMNRGTSANGGVGTGGVTTGSGSNGAPSNTSLDRSGRAGSSASPGANGLDSR